MYLSNIGSTILDSDAFNERSLLAVSFMTGPSAPRRSGPHRLWEVRAAARCAGAPCTLRLSVWTADAKTHAPKERLWGMTQRVGDPPGGVVSFRPATPWLLAPRAGYAIVLQSLGSGSVGQWAYSDRRNFTQAPGWDYVGWGSSTNGERRWGARLCTAATPACQAARLAGACAQQVAAHGCSGGLAGPSCGAMSHYLTPPACLGRPASPPPPPPSRWQQLEHGGPLQRALHL